VEIVGPMTLSIFESLIEFPRHISKVLHLHETFYLGYNDAYTPSSSHNLEVPLMTIPPLRNTCLQVLHLTSIVSSYWIADHSWQYNRPSNIYQVTTFSENYHHPKASFDTTWKHPMMRLGQNNTSAKPWDSPRRYGYAIGNELKREKGLIVALQQL